MNKIKHCIPIPLIKKLSFMKTLPYGDHGTETYICQMNKGKLEIFYSEDLYYKNTSKKNNNNNVLFYCREWLCFGEFYGMLNEKEQREINLVEFHEAGFI